MANTTTYSGGVVRRDLTPILNILQQDRPSLLSLVKFDEPVTSTKVEWHTLTKSNKGSTADGAITAGDGTITVASGTDFTTGDIILINDLTPETFRVSVSGTTLTLQTRAAAGATCVYSHDSGVEIIKIATPRTEARDVAGDTPDYATLLHNYTEIFSRDLIVSGTLGNVNLDEANNDTIMYFTEQKMIELYKEMNYQLLFGTRYVGSASYGRELGGLLWWMTDTTHGTPISTNNSGAALTLNAINELAKDAYNLDGAPDSIVCNVDTARKITSLAQDASGFTINVSRTDEIAGNTIVGVQADWVGGGLRRVVVDSNMPTGALFLTNSKKLRFVPLTGRAIGIQELAKTGDATKYLMLGEYTLKIQDPYNDHAYLFNFTV